MGAVKAACARLIARHRRHPLVRGLARLSTRFLQCSENADYDMRANGELRVLERLSAFAPRRLWDAGANVGLWSLAAAQRCPTARIDAFEISPRTFATLRANTSHVEAISCHALGLSNQAGEVRVRHFEAAPELTTASNYPHAQPSVELVCPVASGDDCSDRLGIDHIDMLKIDVEGMEQQVLEGFSGMLGRQAIDLVQFEYGQVNIINHFLLRDAVDFFDRFGYVVGKIYPNHVEFRAYRFSDENFMGPNYLACRRDRSDLLAALAG